MLPQRDNPTKSIPLRWVPSSPAATAHAEGGPQTFFPLLTPFVLLFYTPINFFFPSPAQFCPRPLERCSEPHLHPAHRLVQRAGVARDEGSCRHRNPARDHRYPAPGGARGAQLCRTLWGPTPEFLPSGRLRKQTLLFLPFGHVSVPFCVCVLGF